MMHPRNSSVDIAKFMAAIFVIGIHTRPLSGISEVADFLLCDIVFRTAIPFFAVCSGFFITKRIDNSDKASGLRTTKAMIRRVFIMYVTWALFYLVILGLTWCKTGLFSMSSFIGWFKSFIIGEPYYHLWYLAQLFWALIFYYPIIHYFNNKWLLIMIAILWLWGVFTYVYSDVLGVGYTIVHYFVRFGAISESAGRLLPLLLVGTLIARCDSFKQRHSYSFISLLFFACLVVEVFLLKAHGATRYSYVVSTLPLAFFLFETVRSVHVNCHFNTQLLSKASMVIYLIHPAIILGVESFIESPICLFLSAVLLSIGFGTIWQLCINKRRWVR